MVIAVVVDNEIMKSWIARFIAHVGLCILWVIISCEHVVAITVTDLLSTNLMSWYNTNSGTTATASDFGVYTMLALDDKLYLGVNKRYPSYDAKSPIFGYLENNSLVKISTLSEDSLFRIKTNGEKIFIPGYDSNDGDWDAGNFYIYNPDGGTLTQKRFRYGSWQYVDATVTDDNGTYSFSNLKPTSYRIRVVAPANYVFTTQYANGIGGELDLPHGSRYRRTFDSNFSSSGYYTICSGEYGSQTGVVFDAPYTEENFDGGLRYQAGAAAGTPTAGNRNEAFYGSTYGIRSTIWNDLDSDGRQDEGEPGLAGVRVEISTRDPYFPCAIHMPSATVNGDEIVVNFGYHKPTWYASDSLQKHWYQPFPRNAVFKSVNQGEDWEYAGQATDTYFSYDMAKLGNLYFKLAGVNTGYITVLDGVGYLISKNEAQAIIATSTDLVTWHSQSWSEFVRSVYIPEFSSSAEFYRALMSPINQLINFKDKLVMPGGDGASLMRFTTGDDMEKILINGADLSGILPMVNDPDFKSSAVVVAYSLSFQPLATTTVTRTDIGVQNDYKTLTVANDKYLYAIGNNNKIYVTTNLKNWIEVADFSQVGSGAALSTIEYWPNRGLVVAATTGNSGSIYGINHDEIVETVITRIADDADLDYYDGFEPTLNLETTGSTGLSDILVKKDDVVVASFSAELSGVTVDFSNIDAEVDMLGGRAVIDGINDNNKVSSETHSLYIPIPEGKTSDLVLICPEAKIIGDVEPNCHNGVYFSEGETKMVGNSMATVDKIAIGGINYWQATGVSGTGGLSSINYGSSNNTVTAVSGTISSSCDKQNPGGKAPWLYGAIAESSSSIRLYYTDADDPVDHYTLRYGTKPGEYIYGADNIGGKGSRTFLTESLSPNTPYYFSVRGGNGCAPGSWSNEMAATTLRLGSEMFPIEEVALVDSSTVPGGDEEISELSNDPTENNQEEISDNEKGIKSNNNNNNTRQEPDIRVWLPIGKYILIAIAIAGGWWWIKKHRQKPVY